MHLLKDQAVTARIWKVRALAGTAAAALALCVTAGPVAAQTSDPAAPVTSAATGGQASEPTAAGTLDPVALQALTGMGNYLKTLKTFELHSTATMEAALQDTDLVVHLGYEGTYRVQRPNAFYIQLKSDRAIREYFYDGKTMTVNVPRQNFYATAPAPATIRQTVDKIYADYGISLPLADLFYWSESPMTDGITSAVRVGFARVNGQDTDQFIYRGPDLDWQVWIARGSAPLPLKIVITDRSDKLRPSYSAELTWNTSAKFSAKDFTFTPDPKSTAIKMASLTGGQ
ncbi:DUF2092 domain-containing protein [Novosphingobium sp. BL-8H]|uniref:DUF2092 domain-containing protein n=1 Tax=Novosphingobium sp. BL-8H TaxID=3127640 RepID=UPI003757ABF8